MIKIVKTIKEVRDLVGEARREGKEIGLVPTMGFLHEGHKSLIDRAVKENAFVVVSDFVNPTQFGPNEDFESYPRDIKKDAELCDMAGADVLFNPEPHEMYHNQLTKVSMSGLTEGLCGASRPTHFDGVCQVVSKLFNIVTPDRAYFGEKDAQQLMVIRKMVEDLNFPLEVVGCPIVREEDGLAKSSRNTYLNADERTAALVLNRSLTMGKDMILSGEKDAEAVKKAIACEIEKEPMARIDYVEIVDLEKLKPAKEFSGGILCAIAVYIGKTRLIDNFIIEGGM